MQARYDNQPIGLANSNVQYTLANSNMRNTLDRKQNVGGVLLVEEPPVSSQ